MGQLIPTPFLFSAARMRQSYKQHSSSLSRVRPQSRCSAKSPWISPISSALISRPCMTTDRDQQKNIFFACLARRVEYRPGDGHLSRYGNFTVLIPSSLRYRQCMRKCL